MTALERAEAQLVRSAGVTPDRAWDLRLDPYWRAMVCRVAALRVSLADLEWDEIPAEDRLKITRALFDAYRLGRSITGRGIA